ncbi:protein kinase domain protein [Ichthyophthirius multifiliis]|uniref:Protein kinase domain protein n=1 Tax=Ichthyophthirius multifiliis TaxID=5932 RepID=G0QXY7_ICHMU|nr:protein kinase domain protein [Ichthyophthirius multifiliis]EGR29939.1 protein kinase domain protein [Ichthyophthirius multifiliis]|eukprot:XP_004031175.1 protein kinase domain protein [Ichthyophthirius multifiliis]
MQELYYEYDNYIWRKKDKLGQGTFGTVYKCKNKKSNEILAVKVFSKKLIFQSDLNKIMNEIEIMKQLNSQNISNTLYFKQHIQQQKVKLIDYHLGEQGKKYLFVKYCEGGNLRKYIQKKGGKLKEEEVISILRQLVNGFQELIKKYILHRDIKPENILIMNGVFKICDFGLAQYQWKIKDEGLSRDIIIYVPKNIRQLDLYFQK